MNQNSAGAVRTPFGHCDWSFEGDYVHIYNLFVQPKFRRAGVASEILQQAINEIRATGYVGKISIVADSKSSFVERLAYFYERMGLEVYGYYG